MPAVARHHAGHDEVAQVQHGAQVYVDQQVDVFRRGLEDRVRPVDTRVVDEHVERHFLRQPRQAGEVGHVEHMRDAAGARGELVEVLRAARDRMHLEALLAQPLDDGSADAGGGTGDEGGLVVGERHVVNSS